MVETSILAMPLKFKQRPVPSLLVPNRTGQDIEACTSTSSFCREKSFHHTLPSQRQRAEVSQYTLVPCNGTANAVAMAICNPLTLVLSGAVIQYEQKRLGRCFR